MRQFRSRSEIVLKFIVCLGVKLVLQILFFKLFIKLITRPFRMCCMKYFTKSFLYYQYGSKSLNISTISAFSTFMEISSANKYIEDLTRIVISYEIYETNLRRVS